MPAMVSATDERFPTYLRIRKRSDYLRVQNKGLTVHSAAFIGIVLDCGPDHNSRLGITTTKRVGSAVARNRIRRLVREALRRGRMTLPSNADMVVVARRATADFDSATIFNDLNVLGKRAIKMLENRR